MHIAIDARMYGTAQRGIGRYLMKLIGALEEIESASTPPLTPPRKGGENDFPPLPEGRIKERWEYTVFLRQKNFEEYQPRNTNFKKALWDAPWYGLKEQLFFKALKNIGTKGLKDKKVLMSLRSFVLPSILYHFPHWNVPLLFNRPFVVTIHDLELFSSNRTRNNSTRGRALYWFKHFAFRIVFRHAVLSARGIIVPSNVVREQLLDRYPQVRKKVQVIYEAPTLSARALSVPKNLETEEQKNNKVLQFFSSSVLTSRRYALYVGAAYPHKNLPRLLSAWNEVRQAFPDYKLVLVGREDFFWKKLKQEYFRNPSQPPLNLRGGDRSEPPLKVRGGRGSYDTFGIVFYGSATDDELVTLYKNAALLVQPSLEEGFSLSPLEAISFGCPAAVSDIPVHREIYGNAVSYFDPLIINSIAEVIKKTITHPVSNPLPREYSWRSHAQETKALYEAVIKV